MRDGEEVKSQTREMSKTANAFYLTDNKGTPIAMSSPIRGNHHYLFKIDSHLGELLQTLEKAKTAIGSFFVNGDASFDSKDFRSKYYEYGMIPNTTINPRNGNNNKIIIF